MHQLADISLNLLIGEWDCPNHNVRATVSHAMKTVCVHGGMESSPVAVVIRYAKQISGGPHGEQRKKAIARALRVVGVEGLGAVPDDDWVEAVRMLGSRGWAMPVVRERTDVVIGRGDGSIAVAKMRAVVQELGFAEIGHVAAMSEVEDGEMEEGILEEGVMAVFDRVRREVADGATGNIVTKVRKWVQEGELRNAAAAYLAAPQVVGRVVEKVKGMGEVVGGISWQLWSDVDDEIDRSLRDLVCGVEEIAVVLGRRCENRGDGSKMRLKRVALMHPWILRRRARSLEGVVKTVLHGLVDRMGRYERPGMKVLEVCVEVMGMIGGVAESDVGGEVLRFLMEEGRDVNGVPDMFGDLSVALFRLLAEGSVGEETSDLIRLAINGKGTSDRIRQAGAEVVGW